MPTKRANAAIVARRCLFGAAGLLLAFGVRAQSVSFTPNTASPVVQSVTTSSAAYQLPGVGTGAADIFWNAGANGLHLKFGLSGATVATSSDIPLCAGCWVELAPGQSGWVAVVADSGTTAVTIVGGQGLATGAGPGGSGGGGGGAVTIADSADVAEGSTADAGWSGSGAGTVVSILKAIWTKLGAVVATVNGTVTANLGTLNGAATAANQATANTSLATIATNTGASTPAGSANIGGVELIDSAGTNKASISAAGAVKTDSSAVTQPVSGSVTANAGTNLNTSALALEAGNAATIATNTTAIAASVAGATPAGGNLIGKIGFDQTTPGTTNGVVNLPGATVPVSATTTTAITFISFSPAATLGYQWLNFSYTAASGGSTIVIEDSPDNFATTNTITCVTGGISTNTNLFSSFTGTTTGVNCPFHPGQYLRVRASSVTSGTVTVAYNLAAQSASQSGTTNISGQSNNPNFLASGKTASGATANENPLYDGGRAENAEATAVTNGQKVGAAYDLVGRPINFPFANKENLVTGTVALTDTTSTSFIAAAAAGLFNYLTGISCTNSGTAGVTVSLKNGNGGTTVWQNYVAPNGGGIVDNPATPITGIQNMTAATALFIVLSGSPSGAVTCNGRGFKGT